MGALHSVPRPVRDLVIRVVLRVFRLFHSPLDALYRRTLSTPGLPIPNPCASYWAIPPSSISKHGSNSPLPEYADVVVIGSGITGASFVRTLLDYDETRRGDGEPIRLVMLEARDACSGATARCVQWNLF